MLHVSRAVHLTGAGVHDMGGGGALRKSRSGNTPRVATKFSC